MSDSLDDGRTALTPAQRRSTASTSLRPVHDDGLRSAQNDSPHTTTASLSGERERLLADVHTLAGEIGRRGTGTPGEQAAARYVGVRLSDLGLPVETRSFRAITSQNAYPLAIDTVVLLALVIYAVGGGVGRWIGAALALSAAPLLWRSIRMSTMPLRPLLPQATSCSVLARVEPFEALRARAVLLAHLDTNKCRIAWQSSSVRSVEPLTFLTLAMLALPGLLYLTGALLGGLPILWWISLLPAAYAVGMVVTLIQDDRAPYSFGAHDNAASVSVGLEVAARLAAAPLAHTQVWLAFTGAEETDHAGLYDLLRDHGALLREATFIGLEGLGSGELVYLTRQGVCDHYRPDAGLLAIARDVAAQHPELGARGAQMTGEDEVGTLRRKGYRAICIAGRDPLTGVLPHWHRADDTADTVAPEFMGRAADYVMAMLRVLDSTKYGKHD